MSTKEQTPSQMEDKVPRNSGLDNAIDAEVKGKGKKRQMPLRSTVWQHFTRFKDTDGSLKGKCKYCGDLYCCDSKSEGTNYLKYHMDKCKMKPSGDLKQTEPAFKPSKLGEENALDTWKFDQEAVRQALTFMIIVDELPFTFVESEGFKYFASVCCPRFKIPSRFTVSRDVFSLYVDEKIRLQSLLKSTNQRVCITADTLTSIQRINYMCVTIHYIDSDWNLRKKIINFTPISSHKGKYIGREIERCIRDWGLDKITTITVDNASSNDTAIEYLMDKLPDWCKGLLECRHIHMRCIAHIVNLIVQDGLKEIFDAVKKVRNATRYVRQSPARIKKFKECVAYANIPCKASLPLDVPTRWNSTYFMLRSAFNLKKAFDRFKELDDNFCLDFTENEVAEVHGGPSRSDWVRISKIILFLEHFYNLTSKLSGSNYVTSNTFFQEIYKLNVLLNEWSGSDDPELGMMALNIKEKYEKYWGDPKKMNKYIYVAVVLDPRYKMDFLEFAFKDMYEEALREEMKKVVHSFLISLFNEYKKELAPESEIEETSTPFSCLSEKDNGDPHLRGQAAIAGRMQMWKQKAVVGGKSSKTEIEKYLSEAVEEDVKGFDVLVWWKNNIARLPILSQVARDVLAIPVSTVASESCFSTGGRVLDSFRSSLTPKIVQSLICSQDWIRSFKDDICVEEDPQQLENLEKEFQSIAFEPEVDL